MRLLYVISTVCYKTLICTFLHINIDIVHNFYIGDLKRRWDGIVSGEITDCYSGLRNLIKWIFIGSISFILYL